MYTLPIPLRARGANSSSVTRPVACCYSSTTRSAEVPLLARYSFGGGVLEFRLSHHCTTGLDRAPCPLPSLLSPARRPSPCWQGDGRPSTTQERNSPWPSGPMTSRLRHMFLCFCQLCNSWHLHPFRTVSTSLHSFPASQPTACPWPTDHRPLHIAGYWAPVAHKWAGVATPQRHH